MELKKILEKHLSLFAQLGGDARDLIFEDPATEAEVLEVEAALGYPLPVISGMPC